MGKKAARFLIFFLSIFLLASFAVPAQQNVPLFLWRIETEGKPSYLCGSVHLMSKDQFPLPAAIENAFENADNLVVEVDISSGNEIVQDPSAMMQMYYESRTVKDVLPPDIYKKTEEIFEELNLPLVMFNSFKPWVLATTIVQTRMEQLGYTADLGLDLYFLRQAHKTGKPVLQLETAGAQITMMSSLSEELQIAMLKDSLNDMGNFTDELKGMFKAWSTGDTKAMKEIVEEDGLQTKERKELHQILLTDRNREMAAKIAAWLENPAAEKGTSYFIVIGAGHFVGEGNIREELARRGHPSIQLTR